MPTKKDTELYLQKLADGQVPWMNGDPLTGSDIFELRVCAEKALSLIRGQFPEELTYPENLVSVLSGDVPEYKLTEDQRKGLDHALDLLPSREKSVVLMHYMEHKTMQEIGEALDVSKARAHQILQHAEKTLRSPVMLRGITDGYENTKKIINQSIEKRQQEVQERSSQEEEEMADKYRKARVDQEFVDEHMPILIADIGDTVLPIRVKNSLLRAGYRRVGDVLLADSSEELSLIKQMGKKQMSQIVEYLYSLGFTKLANGGPLYVP